MKQEIFLSDYIKIAAIHAERLKSALEEFDNLVPLNVKKLEHMSITQIAFLDMMTTRFSKLQDIIGAKIFPLILEILGEDAHTFRDKLNKLEKLDYIDDASWWMELREIRNQITHDYPNNHAILVEHFNIMIPKAKELLEFWNKLRTKEIVIRG
ncbi:MAG: hypothetical protein ACK4OM_00760 [Alphaproteobacteria bacterium]